MRSRRAAFLVGALHAAAAGSRAAAISIRHPSNETSGAHETFVRARSNDARTDKTRPRAVKSCSARLIRSSSTGGERDERAAT